MAQEDGISLRAANAAFNHFDLMKSRSIYKKIVSSAASSKEDKVESLQNLGYQDYKFYKDYNEAIKNLHTALELSAHNSRTYQLLSEIIMDQVKYATALKFSDSAIVYASTGKEKADAMLQKAKIVFHKNLSSIENRKSISLEDLLKAKRLLKEVLKIQPGNPEASELLLGVSILIGDGTEALYAWKAYYFVSDEEKINQVLRQPFNDLKAVLENLRGQDIPEPDKIKLATALAHSNFYDYAKLVITMPLFGKPVSSIDSKSKNAINDIFMFNDFIAGIAKVNEVYYPQIARGLKNYDSAYSKAINEVFLELWIRADETNTKENYNEESFFKLIENRFGALGYLGTTNNFFSVLIGLVIHNEMKEVDQYGFRANFGYISISRMISKDFTTWYGAANVGGWGTDSSMVQIRDAYLQGPFTRLNWVTDSAALSAVKNRISKLKEADLVNCREDKYKEPSFLGLQMSLDGATFLFESLKNKGFNGEKLYTEFIAETMRYNIEATIFAHEGRHAIDQLFFKEEFDTLSDAERELRAKISEIVFSSNQKLALPGSIFGAGLSNEVPHGEANQRFLKILVDWMLDHKAEIPGYDNDIPVQMQITSLTNEQLKNILMNADPLFIYTNRKH